MRIRSKLILGLISLGLVLAVACGPTATSAPDPTATNTPPSDTSSAAAVPAAATPAPTSAPSATTPPSESPRTAATDTTTADPTETAPPSGADVSAGGISADPNYEQALDEARLRTAGWKTDFRFHAVPFTEIFSGGVPRDGIPPIDDPVFTSIENADQWLDELEPVISLEVNGEAKAYPLQVLTWHEIVNDELGGIPVSATFCPLCNSAVVFDRRLDGVVHDFGVSGKLRNSDLIMWDRQTETWWQQLTGDGIVGELAGKKLTFIPATIISWEDFKASHPEALVLSRETGHQRPYGENPYVGYDRADDPPFLFRGPLDGRLLPKERVAAVTLGNEDAAFPFTVLNEERVVNYMVGGQDLVVFFKPGTRSALDGVLIGSSKEVGATGIFETTLNGQELNFRADGDRFVDEETGSVWNILGEAIEGPMTGETLTPIVHANHFWFSWGAFRPDTKIYAGI
ncbi:MAG: DUF3179 domain-containing protein [Dehalococcoidia bacterium]